MVAGEAGADNHLITSFANKFNWHTFQFVMIEISEAGGNLTLTDADLSKFEGRRITNMQTKIGQFTSSVPMLNKIYEAFVQTYEGLTVSGMQVDCTNRERLGYGGDAHSRFENLLEFQGLNFRLEFNQLYWVSVFRLELFTIWSSLKRSGFLCFPFCIQF